MQKNATIAVLVLAANTMAAWGQAGGRGVQTELTLSKESIVDEVKLLEIVKVPWTFLSRKSAEPSAESAEAAEDRPKNQEKAWHGWGHAEYMLWRIKGATMPPLVTTGPFTDALPGASSSLASRVLFGNGALDYQDRSGGRFTLGWWFDDELQWGLSGSYFFLAGRSINYSVSSPGNPVLAVPFFNVNTAAADSSLITFPGIMSGRVEVDAPSFLNTAEANLNAVLWNTRHFHVEALAGFRYAGLNEGLHIQQSSSVDLAPQFVGLVPLNGNTISINDSFDTRNHFYGGQVGMFTEILYKRLSLQVLAKLALGVSNQVVAIRGSTGIDTQPAYVMNAGLLAVASNSGQFTRNRFAVVPEIGLNLGFDLTDHIRICGGYSFLYWSSVARPGDQIDTAINPNLIPTSNTLGVIGGQARPAFAFRGTEFFAHGVNMSLEFRY